MEFPHNVTNNPKTNTTNFQTVSISSTKEYFSVTSWLIFDPILFCGKGLLWLLSQQAIYAESGRNTHLSHDSEETARTPRMSRDLWVLRNAGISSVLLFFAETSLRLIYASFRTKPRRRKGGVNMFTIGLIVECFAAVLFLTLQSVLPDLQKNLYITRTGFYLKTFPNFPTKNSGQCFSIVKLVDSPVTLDQYIDSNQK